MTTTPNGILKQQQPVCGIPFILRATALARLSLTRNTGDALEVASGRSASVLAHLEHAASRLDLYDGKALAGVAEIENQRGHSDLALEAQAEAMDRDPNRPQHYAELARAVAAPTAAKLLEVEIHTVAANRVSEQTTERIEARQIRLDRHFGGRRRKLEQRRGRRLAPGRLRRFRSIDVQHPE